MKASKPSFHTDEDNHNRTKQGKQVSLQTSDLFCRVDNVLTNLRVFKLQQFMKFNRSFRETVILNTGLRFECKMNLIDVLIKLETEKVPENLYKDKTRKNSDITELLDSKILLSVDKTW